MRCLNVIRKFCHNHFVQLVWWSCVHIYARSVDPELRMTNCKTYRLEQICVGSPPNSLCAPDRFNCWFILHQYTRLVEVSPWRNHQPSERNELVRTVLILLWNAFLSVWRFWWYHCEHFWKHERMMVGLEGSTYLLYWQNVQPYLPKNLSLFTP